MPGKQVDVPPAVSQLKAEYDEIAPELARAISALVRGYLPVGLRDKPFSVDINFEPTAFYEKARAPVGSRVPPGR